VNAARSPLALEALGRWAATQACALELITAPAVGRRASAYSRYQRLVAWGQAPDAITRYAQLWRHTHRWRVALLPHELAQRFEPTVGKMPAAPLAMPEVLGFNPQGMQALTTQGSLESWGASVGSSLHLPKVRPHWAPLGPLEASFTRQQYLAAARRLKAHIRAGDVYELNLCMAFRQPGTLHAPHAFFRRFIRAAQVGMGAYLKIGARHVLAFSPERFLQRQGATLRTQPIKGTLPRGTTPSADRALRARLRSDEKFRAENVMIVDLARNDLHRVCAPGSVEVPHLFEVQAFPRLMHLVSTVCGTLNSEHLSPEGTRAAIEATFPPGSMTGAPKVAALKLIAQYEPVGRGAYSGALGYLAPDGDADFNVVIRTLIYDADAQLLTWHVGGAITADSDPAAEWREALLKGQQIVEALQQLTR